MRMLIPERNPISVVFVGKPSSAAPLLFSTREFTQEKNLIDVICVGGRLGTAHPSLSMRLHIVERNPSSVRNVGKLLVDVLLLSNMRGHIRVLLNACQVAFLLVPAQGMAEAGAEMVEARRI